MQQPAGLISVLLDPNADVSSRDDAAMDLAAFDIQDVETALAIAACDLTVDEIIRVSCGESLAEIWLARGHVNTRVLSKLSDAAKAAAFSLLRAGGAVA